MFRCSRLTQQTANEAYNLHLHSHLQFPPGIQRHTSKMPTFPSPSDSAPLYYRTYTPSPSPSSPTHPLTLVLLHGWPMSSRMWEPLLLPLVETHRFRCVAPDRRGFGRSDWGGGEVSWEVFVGDLVELLEGMGVEEFVFVGSSMGCTESLLAYQGSEFVKERCKVCPFPFPLASTGLGGIRSLDGDD